MPGVTAVDDAAWASPWRSRPVGAKVWLSLSLVLTALLAPAWPGCVLVAVVSVGLMLGSARLRPGLVAVVVAPPVLFIVVGALPLAVAVGGDPGLAIASDGGARALDLVAHGVAGSLAVLLLITTTPMTDLLGWTRSLRIPPAILDIAELMYRLLFVLLSTAVALQRAQAQRLGDAAPPGRRLRTAAHTIGTIGLRAWAHATALQRGLELRGYEDQLPTLRRPVSRRLSRVAMDLSPVLGIWLAVAVTR